MVAIRLPPPDPEFPVSPIFHTIAAVPGDPAETSGSGLVRIFDPTDHNQTATTFRRVGPIKRFDHHRSFGKGPATDSEREIYYAALSLEGALDEVFGDNASRRITAGERHVAYITLTRDLRLLDLRGKGEDNGAWRAGSVAALSKDADYRPSQVWSRYFHDKSDIYTIVDGIIYENAHNEDVAIALYERAADALMCRPEHIIRLDDPAFRPRLLEAARRTRLRPPAAW